MHVKNAGAGKRGYLTGNMQTWQGSGCVVDFLVTFFLVHAFVHWKKLRAARCKRTPERFDKPFNGFLDKLGKEY